jgi:peptidoglycan/LPS O-acetylase OafA/YrhL
MLRNLDVLRAVAVLCVVIAHLFRHVLGIEEVSVATAEEVGRFGVLVFFVHTALVLLMSLDRQTSVSPILAFYIRRMFRIYPLSITVVVMVVLFRVPFMPDHAYTATATSQIVQNLLLVQNMTGASSIIGPLWSLPYEVQMYLALPFLHAALQQGSTVRVLGIWFFAIVARVMPLMIGANLILIHFVPCFLGGALAYKARKAHTAHLPSSAWPVLLVCLLGMYVTVRVNSETPFLDYVLCLMLGAAVAACKDMPRTRLTDVCEVVAKYSYGVYLFHAPIMWIAFVGLASAVSAWLQWIVFVVLSFALPWAAYRLIEEPMIAVGRRLAASASRPKYEALKSAASA